ncbi:MAG: mechanosensitive ion channel family protein [Campylobacterales bacterium]|nr:mechanosensitive ion channel family protein [Campylobacterales bacterium]
MESKKFIQEQIVFLNNYDPIVIKLIAILVSIGAIYFIRKMVFDFLEKGLLKIESLENYSKDIILRLRKPSEIMVIIMNFDLIIYIYNDFSFLDPLRQIFNIIYVALSTYLIYILINTIVDIKIKHIDKKTHVKNEVINVGLKILNFAIVLVGILVAMTLMGVNLTAILSGLGIGGLAVALAAKDTLANFFATISILVSDTFAQGDWIQVGSSEGTVVEIGLRVTTLRTFDNALISIPNSTLVNDDVKNWSRRTIGRRIKISLGVKYDSKPDDIKNTIEEIRTMLENHPNIATSNTIHQYENSGFKLVSQDDIYGVKKTLLVYLDEFATSSINILVYCFSSSVVWDEWLEVKQDVMFKIMNILEKNNLEFAFPSLSIYEENK